MIRCIILIVLSITLFGCKQSELIYSYPNYPKTLIEVDLSNTDYTFEGDLYSYSIIFYPVDDGVRPLDELEPQKYRMQKSSDFEISLEPGEYSVVLYSDYSGQNAFYETDSYADVYCEAYSQATLAGQATSDEILFAAEPDPIVISHVDKLVIEDHGQGTDLSGQVVTLVAQQITTTLRARIWLSNPRSISSYSGHVGYVDSRYYITQDRTNHGGLAIAYTSDNSGLVSMSKNSSGESVGYLNIEIDMFGFTQVSSTKYTDEVSNTTSSLLSRATNEVSSGDAFLYLDIELPGISDAVTEHTIDISDYLNAMERGDEVSSLIEIGTFEDPYVILPEMINEDPDADEGGFDVTVGSWDDDESFVLDFGSGTITKE